jgi:hypothetical protein
MLMWASMIQHIDDVSADLKYIFNTSELEMRFISRGDSSGELQEADSVKEA